MKTYLALSILAASLAFGVIACKSTAPAATTPALSTTPALEVVQSDVATATVSTKLKSPPQGCYYLEPFQQVVPLNVSALESDPGWSQTIVNGVCVRCAWSAIEPSDGQINFALFDEAITLAKKYNKKVNFSITAGYFTPSWVYKDGAKSFAFNNGSGQLSGTMPLPWDKVFQTKWFALVQALGARYDADPQLSYVSMGGPGQEMELYFAQSQPDIATFDAMNGQALWLQAAEQIEQTFSKAFPTTYVDYSLAPPTTDATGVTTLTNLIAYCAKSPNFAIRSDGLLPTFGGNGITPTLMMKYGGTSTPTGFQYNMPVKDGYSMTVTFGIAENYKADWVECFGGDVTDPANKKAITAANSALGNY